MHTSPTCYTDKNSTQSSWYINILKIYSDIFWNVGIYSREGQVFYISSPTWYTGGRSKTQSSRQMNIWIIYSNIFWNILIYSWENGQYFTIYPYRSIPPWTIGYLYCYSYNGCRTMLGQYCCTMVDILLVRQYW